VLVWTAPASRVPDEVVGDFSNKGAVHGEAYRCNFRRISLELGLTKRMIATPSAPLVARQSASERRRLRGDGSPEPVIGTCRKSWCDRSIQNVRHSVVRSGYRNRESVGSSRRGNHLGSGQCTAQTGHMIAAIRHTHCLASKGPSTYANWFLLVTRIPSAKRVLKSVGGI
jgi:hypothetical protein